VIKSECRPRRDESQAVRRTQAGRLFGDRRSRGVARRESRFGKTLHRIEESALRQEVEAAGFRLVAEGNFWRNPNDTHDFPSYRPTMPVDNFVLKCQKPM
jgi:predicted methyltransferase